MRWHPRNVRERYLIFATRGKFETAGLGARLGLALTLGIAQLPENNILENSAELNLKCW
jgi:hypothetical protein